MVNAIILHVMEDKRISPDEHTELHRLFSDFTAICDDEVLKIAPVFEELSINGICAICPQIIFDNKWFCFTGAFQKHRRAELKKILESLGGKSTDSIRRDLDYLIIGSDGNPCWAYACYGRKVETVVNLRKEGLQITIVHEYDFLDAVMDQE